MIAEAILVVRLRQDRRRCVDALRRIAQEMPVHEPQRPPLGSADPTEWERYGEQRARWEMGQRSLAALHEIGATVVAEAVAS